MDGSSRGYSGINKLKITTFISAVYTVGYIGGLYMKVSILTYHCEDNYGAVLQAYATQKAVEGLGHESEFIDLRLETPISWKQRLIFALKRARFRDFRKRHYHNLTPRTYRSIEELRNTPPLSDCYLTGSDQTWNPEIAGTLLPAFFLDFGSDHTRRITYATSIGLSDWPSPAPIPDSEISRALKRFNSILLREERAMEIAKDRWKADSRQVVDPVLLFKDYPELTGPIQQSGEIIVYKLINTPEFYNLALGVAKDYQAPIRSIGSVRRPKGMRAAYPEKVETWISRIAGSKALITDSFHGTVLALLYHRPFAIYVGDPKRVSRIVSLLTDLGLSDRILSTGASKEDFRQVLDREIDWKSVDSRLEERRQSSINLLRNALKS